MAQPGGKKIVNLSPEAKAALDTRKLQGGWDARSLGKVLLELERWDEMAEERKAKAGRMFWTGVIGSMLGFFAMVFLGGMFESFIPVVFFVVPLGILIVGIRKKKAAKSIDLPNELRETLRPVVKQLQQDLHPDEKIRAELNLACMDEKHAKKEGPVVPLPSRYTSMREYLYEEDLGELRMPLIDGSEVTLRIVNEYVKRSGWKRGASGKSKSKTKWKKMTTVTAILRPPKPIAWEPGRVQKFVDPACERVTFAEKNGVMVARMDRYYKFKEANNQPEKAAPGADVMRMLVRLGAMRPQAAGGAR